MSAYAVGTGVRDESVPERHAPIDSEQIDAIVQEGRPHSRWPDAIRTLYDDEIVRRLSREEHFLFLLGLLICLATILIDQIVNPDMVREGAVLRVLAVAPITLVGLIASANKWHQIASFCVGASPIAFATVIVHLSLHLPPESAARYLAAAAIMLGLANIVLPYALRGLILFDLAYLTAAFAANVWGRPDNPTHNLDFLVLLAIIGCSTLPLAWRFERLRQHNFLLTLRSNATSIELLTANERLRDLSDRDPLTGLPNRRCFARVFDEMVESRRLEDASADGPSRRIAVMMIDLDHFKAFNDTHGHTAGDECLSMVGHELASIVDRENAIAARHGGEEFVIAVVEEADGDIGRVAEDVRHQIATLLLPVGRSGRSMITTSIGVAIAALDQTVSRDALLETADAALYDAKRAGRNRIKAIEIEPVAALTA
ncbi:MAG: GGDEF domain-containing protein [Pseudomonadota bacterium]